MPENIVNKIMEEIKTDKVKPHPKYYFFIGLIIMISGTVGLFFVSSFFINTLFYSYGNYRNSFAGITPQIPWPAFLITIASFSLGIYLFKKFEISYTKSFTALFLLILVTITLAGYALSITNVNNVLVRDRTFKRMYMMTLQEEDWIQGTVVGITQDSFLIQDTNGSQYTVLLNSQTAQPNRPFAVGDCIKAAGTINDTVMLAKGVSRCGMNGMGGMNNMMRGNSIR